MQALTDEVEALRVSDAEEVQIDWDKLKFKTKYQFGKYESFYRGSDGMMEFVDKKCINLRHVQSNKDKFFRCIGELCPQANPVEELKMLARCSTKRGEGYTIEVDEPNSMVLFRALAFVAANQKLSVSSRINWTLKLDDGTSVNGFIPEHIPNIQCPGAHSDDHARVMFIPSYARWNKKNLIRRWQALAEEMHIVFVVRSYEYDAYYTELEEKCSIFYLPNDTQWGVGYPRYIIVKMMMAWPLKYGITCDDSVCYFGELREKKFQKMDAKKVLTDICDLYSREEFAESVSCISPDVYRPRRNTPTDHFTWRAPTVCQVLNLQLLSEKRLNFRPELRKNLEDLIFGLDCYEKDLKCLRWKKCCILEASRTKGGCEQARSFLSPQSTKSISPSGTPGSPSRTPNRQ